MRASSVSFTSLRRASSRLVSPEEINPKYYDEPRIAELFHRHRGQCLGLKIRLSKDIVGDLGGKPLERTLQIAERLKCPVVVHTTNPPIPPEQIAGMLRPGDVYCHVYQGTGDTIIGSDGKVRSQLFNAQRAGVLFDTANGRKNFSFQVAQAALAGGFPPDIISSDVTRKTLFSDFVFSLPFIMMKFLNLGCRAGKGRRRVYFRSSPADRNARQTRHTRARSIWRISRYFVARRSIRS